MKNSLLIFLSSFILTGCDNVEGNPDCSLVLCSANDNFLRMKYVDKTTGNPLFSEGSLYKHTDLKVTGSSNYSYIPAVQVDDNDTAVIIITPLMGGESLKLGNLPSDKITMQTRCRGKECCAGFEIISLKVNDETICAPCNDLHETIAVIKK